MTIRFDNQVAIVTGAGNGLGKCHALELARLGAKVVVNDFGGARDGSGGSSEAAEQVVAEIQAAGGEAIANGADVSSPEQVDAMVKQALDTWGRIDVLINNAGILRDKSFVKMTQDDWDKVVAVHLTGSEICTRAVWPIMREQGYGRIVMTTSTSGLYGNFGQTNYGAAKAALAGFGQALAEEGANIVLRTWLLLLLLALLVEANLALCLVARGVERERLLEVPVRQLLLLVRAVRLEDVAHEQVCIRRGGAITAVDRLLEQLLAGGLLLGLDKKEHITVVGRVERVL